MFIVILNEIKFLLTKEEHSTAYLPQNITTQLHLLTQQQNLQPKQFDESRM